MEIVTEYLVDGKNVLPGGKPYKKTESVIDNGKYGTVHMTVLDPCITEEAQQKRREALQRTCQELARKGYV